MAEMANFIETETTKARITEIYFHFFFFFFARYFGLQYKPSLGAERKKGLFLTFGLAIVALIAWTSSTCVCICLKITQRFSFSSQTH